MTPLPPPSPQDFLDHSFSWPGGLASFPLLPCSTEEQEEEEEEEQGLPENMRLSAKEKEEQRNDHDVARHDVVKVTAEVEGSRSPLDRWQIITLQLYNVASQFVHILFIFYFIYENIYIQLYLNSDVFLKHPSARLSSGGRSGWLVTGRLRV